MCQKAGFVKVENAGARQALYQRKLEKGKRSEETNLFLKQLQLPPARSQKNFMEITFIYYTDNYGIFFGILDHFATILTMVFRERGKYFFIFTRSFY